MLGFIDLKTGSLIWAATCFFAVWVWGKKYGTRYIVGLFRIPHSGAQPTILLSWVGLASLLYCSVGPCLPPRTLLLSHIQSLPDVYRISLEGFDLLKGTHNDNGFKVSKTHETRVSTLLSIGLLQALQGSRY